MMEMKRMQVVNVSFVILVISFLGLIFFPKAPDGDAVKYVITENGPKFKSFGNEEYEVEEYKENHFYLVNSDKQIIETTQATWKKRRTMSIVKLVIKILNVLSSLTFFVLALFYPVFKTVLAKRDE